MGERCVFAFFGGILMRLFYGRDLAAGREGGELGE